MVVVGRWRGIPCRSKRSAHCPTHQYPIARLRGVPGRFSRNFPPTPEGAPFAGGWIGFLGYELGATLDPAFAHFNPPPGLQAAFAWCPEPRVSDRLMNPSEFDTPSKQGDTGGGLVSKIRNTGSDLCAKAWRERVEAVLQAIGQGDCYQVNLTRREYRSITGPLEPVVRGSSRDRATQAWCRFAFARRSPNRFSQPGIISRSPRRSTAHASHQGDASERW